MRGGLVTVLLAFALAACTTKAPAMTTTTATPPSIREPGSLVGYVARFKAQPGKEDATLAMFRDYVATVRQDEADTIVYLFFRGRADPSEIIIVEIYKDEASRKAHSATPAILAAKTKLPELVDMSTFKVEPLDASFLGFIR